MAHNIEIRNGMASFAENGRKERAWHKLGQVFDGPMTVEEAMKAAHADYEVALRPLIMMTSSMQEKMPTGGVDSDLVLDGIMKDKKVTVRTDTDEPLGIVSSNYGVVQNIDAFRFIDTLCTGGDGTPVIETAGVLGHGERVFVTARFPEQIRLDNKGNDMVEMNMVFTTSHDGSGAVNCLATPVRVVCNNTLNPAMAKNSGKLSLRHSVNVMNRLELANRENAEFAFRSMNMLSIYKRSLEDAFARLREITVNDKGIEEMLSEVLYSDNDLLVSRSTGDCFHIDISPLRRKMMERMPATIDSGVGQDYGERGTGLWVLNGITSFYQNNVLFRSEERKFDSITSGVAFKNVQKAYQLITAE